MPPRIFVEQPIVLLNGCETGTGGVEPTSDRSFPGIFTKLGARGVIITDAPIWQYFALHFGNDIIDEMFKGTEMSQLLLDLRRKYLERSKNPLGLLYSYYGNPTAAFRTGTQ